MTFDSRSLSKLVSISRVLQDLNLSFEKEQGLSLTQWLVLAALKDLPGCTALSLSKTLRMQPSSLTQVLKRLVKKNLISMSTDAKDSRKKILLLTRMGHEGLKKLTPELELQFGNLDSHLITKLHNSLAIDPTNPTNPPKRSLR